MAVIEVNSENFEAEVLGAQLPVLIDFWAPWCAPCRMVSPIVDELSEELVGEIKVVKVNIDEATELAETYNVMSIPTLAVVKDGKVQATSVGAKPKEAIKDMLGL